MLEAFNRPQFDNDEKTKLSEDIVNIFQKRRTIRQYSSQRPSRSIIENAIKVASLAPSGANCQPWNFCIIENQELKTYIRSFCENEEGHFYNTNPNEKWVNDLKHLHTNEEKPFLTQAPYLIVIFYSHYSLNDAGEKKTHYYAKESVGLASGMLLSALHLSGLNTLTYTPKRMQFLGTILDRPKSERPFMIIATGIAAQNATVPTIQKKTIQQITQYYK